MKSAEASSGKPADGEQLVRMNNERFMVPEILFRPSDIGIQQMGLAEAVVESVSACDPAAQPWLYRNILLTGGNMAFPGMGVQAWPRPRTCLSPVSPRRSTWRKASRP